MKNFTAAIGAAPSHAGSASTALRFGDGWQERGTSRDVDADLVATVEAERDVAAARSVEIGQLQRTLLAFVKKDLA